MLGEGPAGTTWLARGKDETERVALKAFRGIDDLLGPFIESAQQSVERLKTVRSGAVALPFEAAPRMSRPAFTVREYVEGTTLEQVLGASLKLPPTFAAGLIHAAAIGLQIMHRQRCSHGNLKLTNVFVDNQGRVRLVDPLVAAPALVKAGLGVASGLVGNPSYLAPEQLTSGHPSASSDVYALGVLAYRLLCGRMPFESLPLDQLRRKKIFSEYPDPKELEPTLSTPLVAFIHQSLDARPAQRGLTAETVAQTIARWLNGLGLTPAAALEEGLDRVGGQVRSPKAARLAYEVAGTAPSRARSAPPVGAPRVEAAAPAQARATDLRSAVIVDLPAPTRTNVAPVPLARKETPHIDFVPSGAAVSAARAAPRPREVVQELGFEAPAELSMLEDRVPKWASARSEPMPGSEPAFDVLLHPDSQGSDVSGPQFWAPEAASESSPVVRFREGLSVAAEEFPQWATHGESDGPATASPRPAGRSSGEIPIDAAPTGATQAAQEFPEWATSEVAASVTAPPGATPATPAPPPTAARPVWTPSPHWRRWAVGAAAGVAIALAAWFASTRPRETRTAAAGATPATDSRVDGLELLGAAKRAADGPPEEAMRAASAAVAALPGNVQALVLLGRAELRAGKGEQALATAGRAKSLASNDPDPTRLEAEALLVLGRGSEAIAAARAAVALRRTDPKAWIVVAHAALAARQLDEAERALGEATLLDPADAEAHRSLGDVHLQSGKPDRARDAYRRAIDLRPEDVAAYHGFGRAALRAGKSPGAADALVRALTVAPADRTLRRLAGELLLAEGRLEDAVFHLGRVTKDTPDDWAGQLALGHALLRIGRIPESVSCFETAERLHPTAEVRFHLGTARVAAKDDAGALADFEAAEKRRDRLWQAACEAGRAQVRLGKPAEARLAFDRAAKLAPERFAKLTDAALQSAAALELTGLTCTGSGAELLPVE